MYVCMAKYSAKDGDVDRVYVYIGTRTVYTHESIYVKERKGKKKNRVCTSEEAAGKLRPSVARLMRSSISRRSAAGGWEAINLRKRRRRERVRIRRKETDGRTEKERWDTDGENERERNEHPLFFYAHTRHVHVR